MQISIDLIRSQTDELTYIRGVGYYEDGLVKNVRSKDGNVRAQVRGTDLYNVILTIRPDSLDGWCDCPAYDKWGFCKHCVAVALACGKDTVLDHESDTSVVAQYLQQNLSKKQLVETLIEYMADDPVALAKWKLRADIKSGTVADTKSLRKQITKALPYEEIWDYHAVGHYFQQAETILTSIAELIVQLTPEQQVSLCSYAYERLNKALCDIDDSNGDRYYLISVLEPIFTAAFAQCDWSLQRKFDYLIDAILTSDDVFPEIPGAFITDDNTAEFYTALEQHWKTLAKPLDKNAESYWPYLHIARMLEDRAEDNGNVHARIDILSQYASEEYELERLCLLHLKANQTDNALTCIKKIRSIESQERNRFSVKHADTLLVQVFQATGQYQDALQLQWELFYTDDSRSNYQLLLELTRQTHGDIEACYSQAEQHFIGIMERNQPSYSGPANQKIIDFYLYTKSFDKAYEIANKQQVVTHQLLTLATISSDTKPAQGFDYMERVILLEAQQTGNRNYDHVADLLRQLNSSLSKHASTTLDLRFNQLVSSLRQSYKRRPNFIKRLEIFDPES